MKLLVGTSGYSYKEWKGNFYPEHIQPKEMLHHYARRLPAVEINNTFYRLPKTSVLENWALQVPDHFRFALKATRRITHFLRLKDAGEQTGYLLSAAAVLKEKLGVLLFQMPPTFAKDLPRLRGFLDLLPEGTAAAFEFRHPSWKDDGVYRALSERDCALCISDTGEGAKTELVATAGWGYLRLRRGNYRPHELQEWRRRVLAQDWSRAFIFFKHEDEGIGPQLAGRFLEDSET